MGPRPSFILAALVLVLAPVVSHAQTNATWNGTVGNWTDATRWSTNPIFPNNGQPNAGDTYNAIINSGTATLDQNITIQGLTLAASGALNGSSNLTANASSVFAGFMTGSGTTTFNGPLTLTTSSGIGRNIINNSITTWNGSSFINNSSGSWTNSTGATFDIQNNQIWFINGGFNNQAGATLIKSAGTGTSTLQVVNNAGSVIVNTGTLDLVSGSSSGAATFSVASGATLKLESYTLTAGTSISGAGGLTISGTTTINGTYSATGPAAISGTATFNSPATFSSLALSGTLTGSGNITISSATTWSGQMAGAGTTTFNGPVALTSGQGIGRNIFNNATTTWSGNSFINNSSGNWTNQNGSVFDIQNDQQWLASAATFNNQAGATLRKSAGTGTTTLQMNINNAGTIDANSGTLLFPVSQTVTNTGGNWQGAGSIVLNGNTTWSAGSMSGSGSTTNNAIFTVDSTTSPGLNRAFVNQGTVNQSTGNGTTSFGNFTNAGPVNINSGTIKLNGGGSTSGTGNFAVAAGATLQFGSGTLFTLAASNSISGPGKVSFSFANVTLDGTLSATGLVSMDGGTLNLNTNSTFSALQTGSFGNFQGAGNVTVSGQSTLTQTIFGGTGTLTFNGPVSLGNSVSFNRPVFHNNTTTVAADAFISGSGTWNNQSGATLNFTNGVNWSEPIANQAGATVIKSGGSGLADLSGGITNAGSVQVNSGTMQFGGNVTTTGSGSYTAAAGATLLFNASNFTLPVGTSISGAGNVTFSNNATIDGAFNATGAVTLTGGTINFNVPATFSSLQDSSFAVLQGSGSQVVNGPSSLGPATLSGTGTTTLNGPVTLNASGQGLILNRTINVSATTTWNSIGVSGTGIWNNLSGALFDAVADNSWNLVFDNQAGATFRKSAGSGTATFSKSFTNAGTVQAQSGTLNFQSAGFTQTGGSTILAGGSISSNVVMNFNGGSLTGAGTLAAPVSLTNASLAPGSSPGTLTINGSLSLGAGTTLDYELGTLSDLTIVNGSLTLDGTLNVSALAGFDQGSFVLIDYSGALTDNGLELGTLPGGFSYQVVNDAANTQIDLIVSSVGVPEPATWLLLGSGACIGGSTGYTYWRKRRRRGTTRGSTRHKRRHGIYSVSRTNTQS